MQNEYQDFKNNLDIFHILNLKDDAPGDTEISNLIDSANQNIKESDFKGNEGENFQICQSINRCLKSMAIVINEKINPDVKANNINYINSNARAHNIKDIIKNEKNSSTKNRDFLANIIKGCEVFSNTIESYQKHGLVSKEGAMDDLKIASYKIARNFAKMMEKDELSKEFFNTHELRIDKMLGCEERDYVDDFLSRQEENLSVVEEEKKTRTLSQTHVLNI